MCLPLDSTSVMCFCELSVQKGDKDISKLDVIRLF